MSGVQYGPDACAVHPGHRHSLNADGVEICWVRETNRPCDIPCEPGLNVERLAKAIQEQAPHTCDDAFLECARAIAAEYAKTPR